jgi:hypothetical protein
MQRFALLRREPGPARHASWTPNHSASKTRVNALMALRSIRGTQTMAMRRRR